MHLTRGHVWRRARDRLAAAGIQTAALDARVLLRHCLGLDSTGLIASEIEGVGEDRIRVYDALIARRLAGEPVARIVGVQEFYGLPFGLNASTLVPRPETELLVDFGIAALKDHGGPAILDLGTGTGCIVLALLSQLPRATGIGVDIASGAINQARANAEALGLTTRFTALKGDWFASLGGRKFDLIVSNPPYIASNVVATLEPQVREHDPMAALDGGADGLDPYREIVGPALNHLVPGGALALETGFDQAHIVSTMLVRAGFSEVGITRDLSGHGRMVTGKRPRAAQK